MTPMAFVMNLMKDGESYNIVIPAAEYFQIGKDPSIIAKYWELLSKERGKNKEKLTSPGSAENQDSSVNGHQHNQELPSDKKGPIKNKWTFLAIRRLVRSRKHGISRFQQTNLNEEENGFWEFVSQKLNKSGYTFSPQECQAKWIKLLSAYQQLQDSKDRTKVTLKEWKIFSMIEDGLKKVSKLKEKRAKEAFSGDTSHDVLESSVATKYSVNHDTANNNLIILKENLDKSFSSQSGSSISDTSSYHCQCCINGGITCSESTPPPWFENFQKSVNAKFENFRSFLGKETMEYKELAPLLKERFIQGKKKLTSDVISENGLSNE